MYTKLPNRTPWIGVIALSLFLVLAANSLANKEQKAGETTKKGGADAAQDVSELGRVETRALLQKSIETVESRYSISAEISHRVDLYGRQFVGKGYYCEERSGPHPLVRFELKMPTGESISSLKQVSDGKFLWINRTVMGKSTLSRVDLARLEKAVGKQGRAGQGGVGGDGVGLGQAISLGGMPGLLRSLQTSFDFNSAELDILYSTPVWKLRGVWRESKLVALLPDQKEVIREGRGEVDLSRLPRHLPDHVYLWLGKDDLLPYRIEYHRTKEDSQGSRATVTMQLMKVSVNVPLDQGNFVFKPGKLSPDDQTDAYIRRISKRRKK